MQSLRKLVNKPRVDDWNPLAKFYYADEALNAVASELDSFDGRRDPERCSQLVGKLRQAQDRLLHIISEMIQQVFPRESDRACRDYRVKFPEEIMHDSLPGQLWFGAECLTAGSNIIDHEVESEAIRPMARALTKHLDTLRDLLKDQSLRDPTHYSDKVKRSLKHFDQLFAEFELNYVSAMVPVKSVKEYDCQLDIAVLFSETLDRALRLAYLTQDQIDDCDPIVMIAVPRLAIVCGLLYFPEGALNVDANPETLSDMFRSFHSLLVKIRDLLRILNLHELHRVEKALCTGETQIKFDEDSVEEALTVANFHLKTTGKGVERILEAHKLQANDSSYSNPLDDVDCNIPGARIASCHANGLAHRMLSPVHLSSSSGNSSAENSSELDLLIMIRPPDSHRLRARFRSSADLIHRLFVCICGVADQLQTNYPTDLRRVLKMILQPNDVVPIFEISGKTAPNPENEEEMGVEVQETLPLPSLVGVRWVPDSDCEQCTACGMQFTLVRRRHHCRNCGRIFCSRCSANSLPLPELGYDKKVRVCNLCFLYKINPFSPCTGQSNSSQNYSINAFNNAVTSTESVVNQGDHERDEDGSQSNELFETTTATTA
ncbi:lateral signaling target protein 2 [Loa loa]|uniref:Lateral signaling target protein 2 n=1 Tax=Loa loa TaxID=7209 RepID=A0A1I7VV86_LOALO|nr:lateral signaling target protein 2 [Loa loa]EFO18827.2 lateral signaling target protein 2 [Loa loa]